MNVSNGAYYALGVGFLALAKLKHSLSGYTTPKPITDLDGCVAYDMRLAARYLEHIGAAGGSIAGKRILELGPGSDLGIGLCLLKAGAAHYSAIDRHPLAAAQTPIDFYASLERHAGIDRAALSDRGRIRYEVREDFDLLHAFGGERFDIVLSNAAFEHFDDVRQVIGQLAKLTAANGLLIAEIDLQTHSRWIREKDPNNIYRYPRWLYRAFYFPGQPNRVRPQTYRGICEDSGWKNIRMTPANQFDARGHTVHALFRDQPDLDWLSFVLSATR